MSCGAEGLLLALKLATELVDKPFDSLSSVSSSGTLTVGGVLHDYRPEWQRLIDEGNEKIAKGKRIKAEIDAREEKLKKQREFHRLAKMCAGLTAHDLVIGVGSPGATGASSAKEARSNLITEPGGTYRNPVPFTKAPKFETKPQTKEKD